MAPVCGSAQTYAGTGTALMPVLPNEAQYGMSLSLQAEPAGKYQ